MKARKPSFLKKRSKKLLFAVADVRSAHAKKDKSFLLLFFKKEGLFLPFLPREVWFSAAWFVSASQAGIARPILR
jgi:hypothetical protein